MPVPVLVKAPKTLLTTLGNGLCRRNSIEKNGLAKKNYIEGKEKYSWNRVQQRHHTDQKSLKVEKMKVAITCICLNHFSIFEI